MFSRHFLQIFSTFYYLIYDCGLDNVLILPLLSSNDFYIIGQTLSLYFLENPLQSFYSLRIQLSINGLKSLRALIISSNTPLRFFFANTILVSRLDALKAQQKMPRIKCFRNTASFFKMGYKQRLVIGLGCGVFALVILFSQFHLETGKIGH